MLGFASKTNYSPLGRSKNEKKKEKKKFLYFKDLHNFAHLWADEERKKERKKEMRYVPCFRPRHIAYLDG